MGFQRPSPDGIWPPGEVLVPSTQIRAARGWLDWTVRDLAERFGVHRESARSRPVRMLAPPRR